MKITYSLLISCLIVASFTSCNVKGFFVKPSDEPQWVDPNPPPKGGVVAELTGEKVFKSKCAACHQTNGKGLPGSYPPLVASKLLNSEATISIRIVLHGIQGQIVREGLTYNGAMTPHKDILNDLEIADVLTYSRSQWGNTGTAVTEDVVKTVREKTAAQATSYSESDLTKPL